jgi:hypothetical protein
MSTINESQSVRRRETESHRKDGSGRTATVRPVEFALS